MPTRSETVKLRVTDAELADYKLRAGAAGMSLSDWIRYRLVDVAAGLPVTAPDRPSVKPVTPIVLTDTAKAVRPYASERPRAKRSTMCEHRRRPDEFCPRCD